MPVIVINCATVVGRIRQISSSDESCSTTYAGIPFSLEVVLRHSRKYSRRSASTAPAAAAGIWEAVDRTAATVRRTAALLDATLSHSGAAPHTSHAPHDSHFGVSPKCVQIARCRHLPDSTNPRITLYRSHARCRSA